MLGNPVHRSETLAAVHAHGAPLAAAGSLPALQIFHTLVTIAGGVSATGHNLCNVPCNKIEVLSSHGHAGLVV